MNEQARDIIAVDAAEIAPPTPQPSQAPDAMFALIERIATTPGVNLDALDRIVALRERIQASEAKAEFDAAISAAKAEIPVIVKNKHVGFESKDSSKNRTDYDHEDFAQIAKTIDPILGRHGLSYRFRTIGKPGEPITVTCIVSHSGGHREETELTAPHDASGNKNAIQAIGSTVTFLQRYTLKAALGLAASKDDDGAASSAAGEPIGPDEVAYIDQLLRDTESDRAKFLDVMKAESVEALTVESYKRAIVMLNRKKQKVAQK